MVEQSSENLSKQSLIECIVNEPPARSRLPCGSLSPSRVVVSLARREARDAMRLDSLVRRARDAVWRREAPADETRVPASRFSTKKKNPPRLGARSFAFRDAFARAHAVFSAQ